MRTTIELKPEHRSRLLAVAAQRGEKGFSSVVAEAIDAYLDALADGQRIRQKALALEGRLTEKEARQLRTRAATLRRSWR